MLDCGTNRVCAHWSPDMGAIQKRKGQGDLDDLVEQHKIVFQPHGIVMGDQGSIFVVNRESEAREIDHLVEIIYDSRDLERQLRMLHDMSMNESQASIALESAAAGVLLDVRFSRSKHTPSTPDCLVCRLTLSTRH